MNRRFASVKITIRPGQPLGRGAVIVSEALLTIRPPGLSAVESAPNLAHAIAQEETVTVQEKLAQGAQIDSQGDTQALVVRTAAGGSASNPRVNRSRCSFCRGELEGSLELTIPGSRKNGKRDSSGLFCSTQCRNCVLALAALHPSPLASSDFISKRALLTDRLLDLWRRGQGPDPALVLEAAKRAGCGLPTAFPAL